MLTEQQLAAVFHQIDPGPKPSPTAFLRFARVFITIGNRDHIRQASRVLHERLNSEPRDSGVRPAIRMAIHEIDYVISRFKE